MKAFSKIVTGILSVLVMSSALIGCSRAHEEASGSNPSSSSTNDDSAGGQSSGESNEIKWIPEGMYKVGTDLDPGEYLILASTSANMAYFQVTKDSTGTFSSILSNDNFQGSRFITLTSGQYLTIRNAVTFPSATLTLSPKEGRYLSGEYRVGIDIKAGEYKVLPEDGADNCYFQISRDSRGTLSSIIANDNFSAARYVTLKNGQYFKMSNCYILATP